MTAREQMIELIRVNGQMPRKFAVRVADALLAARLSTACPTCEGCGRVASPDDYGASEPCDNPDCTDGQVPAGSLLLGLLVDTGQIEQAGVRLANGAVAPLGRYKTYADGSTEPVWASVVPVPEDGERE